MVASALASGLVLGAIYALVAAGLNLIFGVVKIINFAQGALLTVGVYLVYGAVTVTGVDPYLTLPVVVVVMGALGYLIQIGIIDRVLRQERISQLLITFGLALALRNGALLLWGPDHRSVQTGYGQQIISVAGVRFTVSSLLAVVGSLVCVTLLYLFLHRSRLGTAVRCVAQQPDSAELAGINVRRIYALAFGIGTALVGVAAVLIAPIYAVHPEVGEIFGIMAFIVVILGGLGSVFGAALAGVLIGLAQNVFATFVSVQFSTAFVFLAFILVMLVRPSGLFGRSARVS